MSEFQFAGGSSSVEARQWAADQNLDVRAPQPNELFLDIDNEAALDTYAENYDIVDRIYYIHDVKSTPSRNKPNGKHIVVTLGEEVTPTVRCLLQAILGSDRRREAHSLQRIKDGDPEPTLFFEKRPDICTKTDPISPTQSPLT